MPEPRQLPKPLLFAHRGGMAHAPENTAEAFGNALEMGVSGLESDVRLSKDNVPVLMHNASYFHRGMRLSTKERTTSKLALAVGRHLNTYRRVSHNLRVDLPPDVLSLEDLYQKFGCDFELSLDIKVPEAAEPTVRVAKAAEHKLGKPVLSRLWLCHQSLATLAHWRKLWPEVRLVNSTSLKSLREGPERRAAQLAEAGIDAINFHHSDWNKGLVALMRRFEVLAFAWDAQLPRVVREMVAVGVDGIHGDNVKYLLEATQVANRPSSKESPAHD